MMPRFAASLPLQLAQRGRRSIRRPRHPRLYSSAVNDALPASMSAISIETRDGELLSSMKAIRAAGDSVTLRLRPDQPLPQIRSDEVLIKVDYAGVNRPDVVQRKGLYPPPQGASSVLGLEVSGTVVALGAKLLAANSVVDPWDGGGPIRVGDQVCALVPGGGYAEYAASPVSSCLRVPRGFSQLEAAALPETFFTVWTNVFQRGVRGAELAPEESILVHGGTSGIGTVAIQLASAMGAKNVIATAGNDEKCEACIALGATLAVNYRNEDYVSVIKEHCGGVDVVLDMVGGDYLQRNLTVMNKRGRHVSIAFLNGSKSPEPFDFGNIRNISPPLAANHLSQPVAGQSLFLGCAGRVLVNSLTLTGSTLRPRPASEKGVIAAELLAHVWPLLDCGKIRPRIDTVFELGDAMAAHELMESSMHMGKIMLRVNAAVP
eukprot:COSAG02_NODE_1113_length_14503_cov_87.812205_1_plen_434_part_00